MKKNTTLYPSSSADFLAAESHLLKSGFKFSDNASGEGYSGAEARGWATYAKGRKKTDVVFPPAWGKGEK